jgi:hypothetical protein
MDQQAGLVPPRLRVMGEHELIREPMETLPGWVVACSCGWSNTESAGQSPHHARLQFTAHRLRNGLN